MKIIRDYETCSAVDLAKAGAAKYAQHPSTQVICLAIKIIAEGCPDESLIWVNPKFRRLLPGSHKLHLISDFVLQAYYNGTTTTESHNDGFEQAIDRYIMEPRYDVPMIPLERRSCSAAQAATNALPRDLETLSEALGLAAAGRGKDLAGHALMLKMCKPLPMNKKRWEKLDGLLIGCTYYERAKQMYREASNAKGKAYSTFVADNWSDIAAEGFDPASFLFWHHDTVEGAQDLVRLCQYCLQDVEAEYDASTRMPPMNYDDMKLWRLDQEINQRGVHIDVKGAQDAINMVNDYKAYMTAQLKDVTGGKIQTVNQHKKIKEYCFQRGVDMPNTAKDTLEYFLRDVELPGDVKRLLEIRVACGQTSTTKYEAMLRAASETDARVRGVFINNGAAPGRWTAKLLQLHNMPRGTFELKTDEDIEAAYRAMACGWGEVEALYGDVMGLAASAVRGAITAAPGNEFIVSDFSSIEARMLLWMACDEVGLQVYRDGRDAYMVAASDIFGVKYDDVTGAQRSVGKVCILSLGYGGGIGAFASMARNYGIDLETLVALVMPTATGYEFKKAESIAKTYLKNLEDAIKLKLEKNVGNASFLDRMSLEAAMSCDIIKQRWRVDRPKVLTFWSALETAAFAAIQNPSQTFSAGPYIKFGMMKDYLLMQLPSGRCVRYYKPQILKRKKFGKFVNTITYMRVNEGQWRRVDTYGGKLCENADQAASNCLLRHAMFKSEEAGYPIVMHVHDEPVAEVPEGSGDLDFYNSLIIQTPDWALGLPMASEGWRGRRYRKA